MCLAAAQGIKQLVDRSQQGARVSIHAVDGIAMHRRERRFLVTLEELADTYDHIQRSS